ncbi:MAG: hypothetical protein L6R30_17535 [Thermoanaerobaculia bacterium]|nr:hypothetical protein [Thermoanaerobaculia bacterium]
MGQLVAPGDGGPARGIVISYRCSIAVDVKGNLLIADHDRNRIRRVSAQTGLITTIAGNSGGGYAGDGGPATEASLWVKYGGGEPICLLTTDARGNIYLADYWNFRIRIIDPSGIIRTVAGNGLRSESGDGGPATAASISTPTGIALDSAGNIYLATENHRVRKISVATGIISTVAGNGRQGNSGDGGPATAASLSSPQDIAFDHSGNMYIGELGSNRIRKVSPAGIISTFAGDGRKTSSGDGGPATSASLTPDGIVVDSDGNVYVCDRSGYRIRMISATTGIITTIAGDGSPGQTGGDGNPATRVRMTPSDIALDAAGNVVFSGDYCVRRIEKRTGIVYTIAGGGSTTSSLEEKPSEVELIRPVAVAADDRGGLLIAESYSLQSMRRHSLNRGAVERTAFPFSSESIDVTTGSRNEAFYINSRNFTAYRGAEDGETSVAVAGNGARLSLGPEGTAATSRRIFAVQGLAGDSSGNLYLSETYTDRVLRVSAATGAMTTFAGNGVPRLGGDGAAATMASLYSPRGLAIGTGGDLYIADMNNNRVRRVDATGTITTVAGTRQGYSGDGGPATAAQLYLPDRVGLDAKGNLFIGEYWGRVRRVDAATGFITTIAGNGSFASYGDGGPATLAAINMTSLVADRAGHLYIGEAGRVRRVDATSGIIATIAGDGTSGFTGDGGPATAARIGTTTALAVDPNGNLYIGEYGRIRKISAPSGIISTVATEPSYPWAIYADGSGDVYVGWSADGWKWDQPAVVKRMSGMDGKVSTIAGGGPVVIDEGVPATQTGFDPVGIALDRLGNLYVADRAQYAVRRVSSNGGIVTTVAGTGVAGTTGDGGPATAVPLYAPARVAVGSDGDLYVSDGNRVRRVDAISRTISTLAGDTSAGFSGDGGTASAARLSTPRGLALDQAGDLFIADSGNSRIRKVARGTTQITTVAGGGTGGLGDGGPATAAALLNPEGVTFDENGSLFIADTGNNRIRAVYACRQRLGGFDGTYPLDGSQAGTSDLAVSWSGSEGAFRYDLLVDTAFPPRKVIQSDMSEQGFQLSGLASGTTYFWQVRAKGDPYCPAVERSSGVRKFSTATPCSFPPPPTLVTPTAVGTSTTLRFEGVPGASSYDIYLSTGNTETLVASGLTTSSYTVAGLHPGTTYRYRVVARAACNDELLTTSAETRFTVAGGCEPPAPVELTSPANNSVQADSIELVWKPSPSAATYDIYLGEQLLVADLAGTRYPLDLNRGTSYSLKIVARAACDRSLTSPPATVRFTTSGATDCPAPAAVQGMTSTKSAVFLGSTYVLSWEAVQGASSYRIQRTAAKGSGPESIATSGTSVVLSALLKDGYDHSVTVVSACGSLSAPSSPLSVSVSPSPPVVSFTNPPRATVIRQRQPGQELPRLEVEVRNTGTADFVGFLNTSQAVPFFLLSETVVSLRSGEARIFYLQFSGVPPDQPGSYEGLLTLQSSDPSSATSLPQMAVSLRVAGVRSSDPIPSTTAPVFQKDGAVVEEVRFAPTAEGDQPPDIFVDLRNLDSTPLELAADIFPDSWVSISDGTSGPGPGPASAWNASAIPAGGTRTLRLSAQRTRGASGGAYPRYAYLTVRTIDGKSSRLLIQDSNVIKSGPCPGRSALGRGGESLIVPSLVNAAAKGGGRYVSKLLLTNLGPDPIPAHLYYTPDTGEPGTSGYDCGQVLYASLIVPGHDVVALTDPVGTLFKIEGSGQLEVRSTRIGQLRAQSVADAPATGGGSFGFGVPVIPAGQGARHGIPHGVIGVRQDATYRSNLILSETSGQPSSVTVHLYDLAGRLVGSTERNIPPYGKKQFGVSELTGSSSLDGGALEIVANPGSAGSVAALLTIIDGRSGDASSLLARPLKSSTAARTFVVPSVVVSNTFKSRVEIRNNDSRPVVYSLRYRDSTGSHASSTQTLAPKAVEKWESVLSEVFGLAPLSFGPLIIESDSPHLAIVSRVFSESAAGSYGDTIEAYTPNDPIATGAGGPTLVSEGLEGNALNDRTRGARTNLILTEIAGGNAELEISIWEKTQRRLAPAGTIKIGLGPNELRQINDLFGDEGFGIGGKDRLNVLCTIRPIGGTGTVVALATRIDNKTQDTKNLVFRP